LGLYGVCLVLYIDESGQTDYTLFHKNQPMLDDGVVSSKVDMDIVAERRFIAVSEKPGVEPCLKTREARASGPISRLLFFRPHAREVQHPRSVFSRRPRHISLKVHG
jgi:hypothetical protein